MFEAFWRKWGLYFTARTTMDGIGSTDLFHILEMLDSQNPSLLIPITDESDKSVLDRNKDTASRFFLSMILARLYIFHFFVDFASKLDGGLQEQHKGKWLLLQLAPRDLVGQDIFFQLTLEVLALQASFEDMTRATTPLLLGIQKLIGKVGILSAFDEAQISSRMRTDCFRSESDPTAPRPLTGVMLNTAMLFASSVMIAGTGMSLAVMKAITRSAVARETNDLIFIKELGWFDSDREQQAYMARYCPSALLCTDSWRAVLSRAAKWLCGRYVGNACSRQQIH